MYITRSLQDRSFIGRSALDNPLIANLADSPLPAAKEQLQAYIKLYDQTTCRNCFVKDSAGTFNFSTNALEVIEAEITNVIVADNSLNKLVSIQTDVPFGAQTSAYRLIEKFGLPSPLGNTSNAAPSNIPLASTVLDIRRLALRTWAIKVSWNVEEIAASLLAGVPLEVEQIQAAMQGSMQLQRLAIMVGRDGVSDKQTKQKLLYPEFATGKFNDAGVDAATASATDWSTISEANASEIRKAITDAIGFVYQQTQETVAELAQFSNGMNVFLPPAQFQIVTDTLDGNFRTTSIADNVKTRNVWTAATGNPVTITPARELAGIGVGSTDRFCIGFVNPNVDLVKVSQQLTQAPQQQRDLVTEIPFFYAHSPIGIKQPKMMAYRDGI